MDLIVETTGDGLRPERLRGVPAISPGTRKTLLQHPEADVVLVLVLALLLNDVVGHQDCDGVVESLELALIEGKLLQSVVHASLR
ncbi:MAG: hypothetical protein IPI43_25450 [Sandaracinaceae bacterium]|nr:hypothetical protein [Sandaracinaceae bacterium]